MTAILAAVPLTGCQVCMTSTTSNSCGPKQTGPTTYGPCGTKVGPCCEHDCKDKHDFACFLGPCHGYEPTCWRPWSANCPACPPQGCLQCMTPQGMFMPQAMPGGIPVGMPIEMPVGPIMTQPPTPAGVAPAIDPITPPVSPSPSDTTPLKPTPVPLDIPSPSDLPPGGRVIDPRTENFTPDITTPVFQGPVGVPLGSSSGRISSR